MKKDEYISKYCIGSGIEIGGADNCVEELNTVKIDVVTEYVGRKYDVNQILDAHALVGFEANQFDFLITIHVMEHLTNPIKALYEWHRVVKDGGYIFTAIPKKCHTFDRYRQTTELRHLLEDYYHNVGRLDLTHVIEFNQFSVPAIYLDWKHELVPSEDIVSEICDFYRGKSLGFTNQSVQKLWLHLESEKQQHLDMVRNGQPLDLHFHVWENLNDVEMLCSALEMELVEIVDDYMGNSILFVIKVDKNREEHVKRMIELKNGRFPEN